MTRELPEFLVAIGTLATITTDQKEFLRRMCVAHQRKVPESEC
jgi:tagatose-1,6-bisphosphate aldolase